MPITQKWCTSKGTSCDSYEQAQELEECEVTDIAYTNIEEFINDVCDRDGFSMEGFMNIFKTSNKQALDFVKAVNTLAIKFHKN